MKPTSGLSMFCHPLSAVQKRVLVRNKCLRSLIIAAGFVLGIANSAWADRVTRLIQILETDSSYKVRLQVCVTLGNLKDKRAVPALIKVLTDENFTVRGVAAAALGQIGDKSALPELKKLAKEDSNPFVRSQAEKAIKALAGAAAGPPPGAKFFLTIGKMTSKAKKGADLPKILGEALLKEFNKVTGVVTDWGGRNPTGAELSKRNIKGFVLDGSILSLTQTNKGENIEISCTIKVSLATFPGNSMKAFYTGGAGTEVAARSFKPEIEESIYRDILEGAAQDAKQNIVQSFLSTQ
jgi:hypothetical protein